MNYSSLLIITICAGLPLLACGGSSNSDGAGGSAASGGSSGSGGATGGGGSAGAGAGGSGGAIKCTDYLSETSPNTVTMIISNTRTTPVYVGDPSASCGPVQLFRLTDPSGKGVPNFASGCGNDCEALQQHDNYCSGACLMPALIRIGPGGSYQKVWPGTTFRAADMPESCWFTPQAAASGCDQRFVAETGDYSLEVSIWTDANCNGAPCDCQPDASGSCEVTGGGQPTGSELSGTSSFAFPKESSVTVSFN